LDEKIKSSHKSEYGFTSGKCKCCPWIGLFLTSRDLAKIMSVSVKTIERWRDEGGGPPYLKVSKQYRYPVVVLDKWVRESLITQG